MTDETKTLQEYIEQMEPRLVGGARAQAEKGEGTVVNLYYDFKPAGSEPILLNWSV